MALTNKLSAIGEAIREKTGKSELLTLDAMPEEIRSIVTGGGEGIPEEAFIITGECSQRFAYDGWSWFIELYGNQITTKDITNGNSMFQNNRTVKEIPFAINYRSGYLAVQNMFTSATCVREVEINTPTKLTQTSIFDSMFRYCNSLRKIKGNFLEQAIEGKGRYSYGYGSTFTDCYVLDEIVEMPFMYGSSASYSFYNTFTNLYRLKKLTFRPFTFTTQTDYKGATIDLTKFVGYASSAFASGFITNTTTNNSGITTAKRMDSAETLAALYNDPDCWTTNIGYSRYNHDSAVETINSLPDVTAVSSGGTSIIKFKGQSGASTPAGAIENLTEEEIAVATAKGWTVSFA